MKEVYYYLDNTPDHTYMRALYRYPMKEFPYERLRNENVDRQITKTEYEILDTGKSVFHVLLNKMYLMV